MRAFKPKEKKSALNPLRSSKRKRKELIRPAITKTSENINNLEDKYGYPPFDSVLPGDATSTNTIGKVYTNFA